MSGTTVHRRVAEVEARERISLQAETSLSALT
jgi:hypothetical protein